VEPLHQITTGNATEWRALRSLKPDELAKIKHNDPRLDSFANHIEKYYELPPGLIVALKNAGEKTETHQVSSAGAKGVMQFIESTRKKFPHDPQNPMASIDAAGRYLKATLKQYNGNVRAAIADYNGGPPNAQDVIANKEPRSKETRAYLQRVDAHMRNSSNGGR
jgi:soluble lytic murein transglycosylase-like protein